MEIITLLSKLNVWGIFIALFILISVYLYFYISSSKIEKLFIRGEILLLSNLGSFIMFFLLYVIISFTLNFNNRGPAWVEVIIMYAGLIGFAIAIIFSITKVRTGYFRWSSNISKRLFKFIMVSLPLVFIYFYILFVFLFSAEIILIDLSILGFNPTNIDTFAVLIEQKNRAFIYITVIKLFFIYSFMGYLLIFKLLPKFIHFDIKINLRLKDGTTINDWYLYRITYGNNIIVGNHKEIDLANNTAVIPKENINFIEFTSRRTRAWEANH